MGKPFYLHKRGGVFYACLVNQETGERMSARSTGERDKESTMITVSGWLRATLIKPNRTTEDTCLPQAGGRDAESGGRP